MVELGLPKDSLIVLINRNEQYVVPKGATTIEAGDILLILANKKILSDIKTIIS